MSGNEMLAVVMHMLMLKSLQVGKDNIAVSGE